MLREMSPNGNFIFIGHGAGKCGDFVTQLP
ncbi:predicted protein [Sclerotinia sclerotiorum 1980 UF-70]|uniref:Uncharacterized protein n=1 Tax=Sclerotinia sclerotiorum (strain ATCC 18683 / 1980 / Ss-1) TaxID=665079 RepID=A7EL36_SCLS1|nr:predicted protein [Sclerotinia sclerotiorum 1980 UF-70]EDO03552.1 predicted protein [Sclerotinia sclerotiorum 1980 UF-70]